MDNIKKRKRETGVNIEESQAEGISVCSQIVSTEMNSVRITHGIDLMSLGFAM